MLATTLRRYATVCVALAALALFATACGGDTDPETAPTGGATSSATDNTPEVTTDPSPTPDPDAWRTKFDADQLKAYDTALQRWESYEARSEPLWAKGKATPAAEKLLKEFFPHPIWMDYWEKLQGYEQVKVKVSGTPMVYWSKARSVTKSGSGVQIQQCVDYTPVKRTQDGEEIPRPAPKPQMRTIFLSQPDGYDWLIYGIEELVDGKPKTCTP